MVIVSDTKNTTNTINTTNTWTFSKQHERLPTLTLENSVFLENQNFKKCREREFMGLEAFPSCLKIPFQKVFVSIHSFFSIFSIFSIYGIFSIFKGEDYGDFTGTDKTTKRREI